MGELKATTRKAGFVAEKTRFREQARVRCLDFFTKTDDISSSRSVSKGLGVSNAGELVATKP